MTQPDSYFTNDGIELHRGCDGEIMNFKEGWICGECKKGGEWAAQSVPTESTVSASSEIQERTTQTAPVNTEAPSTSEPPTVSVGGTELQALVDAHYATLNQIISDTISKLEALQARIPDGQHKVELGASKIGPMLDHVGFTTPWMNDALPPYYAEESNGLKPK